MPPSGHGPGQFPRPKRTKPEINLAHRPAVTLCRLDRLRFGCGIASCAAVGEAASRGWGLHGVTVAGCACERRVRVRLLAVFALCSSAALASLARRWAHADISS